MGAVFRIEREGLPAGPRAGVIETPHGAIRTPALIPLAEAGAVQSLTPEDLTALGVEAVAVDAFELAQRPGLPRLETLGGLRRATGWNGPVLALSGSYRLLGWDDPDGPPGLISTESGASPRHGPHHRACRPGSAGAAGLKLASPVDGATRPFAPEDLVAAAEALGADLAVALDEPLPAGATDRAMMRAKERTDDWARRSLASREDGLALFGVVSSAGVGGAAALPFFGFAMGGPAIGSLDEPPRTLLPPRAPRLWIGCAEPADVAAVVRRGADVVVTRAPLRLAEAGALLTDLSGEPIDIREPRYERDAGPLVPGCGCATCRQFSRAYLRHLFLAEELLGYRLAAVHNLHRALESLRLIRAGVR